MKTMTKTLTNGLPAIHLGEFLYNDAPSPVAQPIP